LQAAVDKLNVDVAANQLSEGKKVVDAEYTNAFAGFMRKGEIQASLNKATPAEGGYFAPVEWDRTILDKLIQFSPMRSLARSQKISTAGFSKLFNNHGTVSGWVGETAARPETNAPTISTLTYKTGEIYANPSATQGLLDDSEVDLEQWLAGEVNQEFAFQEGVAFISGTGANDRPNGVLTYVTGGTNAATHPWGAILATNSGAAAALTTDGIVNLVYALPSEYSAGAGFVMNRATHLAARKLKDGQGNYIWQPSYQAGEPAQLLGYGITEMASMPDIAAAAKPILFGDFKQGYLIVDRVGTRLLRDPFTNKPYVQFYTTKRVGGGVLDPLAIKALNISV
jgi:HK97 family phage major capsid protein